MPQTVPDALEIDLSREGPHSIDVASPSIETGGDFDIVLRNHGPALHVHLNLEPGLARAATLSTANHYVEEDAIRRVRVAVDRASLPGEGLVKIVTGYGAETEFVTVRLVEDGDTDRRVRVDESLAKPRSGRSKPLLDPDALPVIALGVIAFLIAIIAALVIDDPILLLGVLIVMAGIAIAGGLLAR